MGDLAKVTIEHYRKTIKEEKRASILKAALSNFLAQGYSRAAMASIARDADVSTATLYKNFDSKEALFAAVATQAAESAKEDIIDLPDDASVSGMFFRVLFSYHAAQQAFRVNDLLRIVIAEVPTSPKLARTVYDILIEGRHRDIKAFIDLAVERGFLRPHDTALGARFLAGMIKELAVWPALFDPAYVFPEDIADQASEAFKAYLARYGASASPETRSD